MSTPIDPPLPIRQVIERLSSRHKTVFTGDGPLTEAAGNALFSALRDVRPDLGDLMDNLAALSQLILSDPTHRRLAWQKDALGVLFDMAFSDHRTSLRKWAPASTDAESSAGNEEVSFLTGMTGRQVAEASLIDHDSARFPGWLPVDSGQIDVRRFVHGNQTLEVMNVNNTRVERELGIDLLYHHVQRDSFVLVQYKKLTHKGADEGLWYYRDGRLDSQIERMRAVDDLCDAATGEFRLHPKACYFKFCESLPLKPDDDKLIPGLYVAREHLERLLVDPAMRGKKGWRLGYDNMPRNISNTQFTKLVNGGWIGSPGKTSDGTKDAVRALVEASLTAGHSVMVGRHHSPVIPRS